MKVHLLFADADFDPKAELPENAVELSQDLGLSFVMGAMGGSDKYFSELVGHFIFSTLTDPDAIRYRQAVLDDCLRHPDLVRDMYAIVVDGIEAERKLWGYTERLPQSVVGRSIEVLTGFVDVLRRLRVLAQQARPLVRSEALGRLFEEMVAELDDPYLASVSAHLERLKSRESVLLSSELGVGTRPDAFVLRRPARPQTLFERLGVPVRDSHTYRLADRDDAGARMLGDLRDRGLALAAEALGRSTEHLLSYLRQLRTELAFFICAVNLRDYLAARGVVLCTPTPLPTDTGLLRTTGLRDAALALAGEKSVVGNDVDLGDRSLIVITGANRGGKSTFLRSLGQAQLMMQAGLFVAAQSYEANVAAGMFTHFKREEDENLRSGKLDEELARMASIIDLVKPGSLVLMNESFASTNEREGAELGAEIVRALVEAGIKVGYVTHMYALAQQLEREHGNNALSLRAERLTDGRRTFRVVPGVALPTSHGVDIYRRVFGSDPAPATQAASR